MRHEEFEDEDAYLDGVIEERGGWGTFVLGAIVGAGVALLLAPRTGRETQAEIARALGGVRDAAGGPVDGARESLAGWVGEARGRVTGRLDEVRAAVDDRLDRVRGAVDEGRLAATQARVELRRRVDEAKAAYHATRESAPAPGAPRPLSIQGAQAGPAAGAAGAAAPAAPAAEGAAGPVVVTEVTVERDPGDLAG